MSFGYVDLTVLVEYTRVAMSTSTMLIRNVHGTYPPHVAIRRSYIVFTYPIAIGGGHSARHMSESACATSTLISDILLVHDNPGIFLEQRSLGQIFRGKILWTYILDIYHLSIARGGIFFYKLLEQWGLKHISRTTCLWTLSLGNHLFGRCGGHISRP